MNKQGTLRVIIIDPCCLIGDMLGCLEGSIVGSLFGSEEGFDEGILLKVLDTEGLIERVYEG